MNITKKLGLTALAGSLIATSAIAGEMSASGSASITYSSSNKETGNSWTMGDSVTFSGGGDLDNGWTVNVSYELDGDASGTASSPYDDQSIAIGMGDAGTLTFHGHGASDAVGAWDDKTPTAYEEVWYGGGGVGLTGFVGENAWVYEGSFGGIGVYASYQNAHTAENSSDTSLGVKFSGVEGLEIGYAAGENEASSTHDIDHSVAYITYAMGSVTIGATMNDVDDSANDTGTDDSSMHGYSASFAVNENFSISAGVNNVEWVASGLSDQEASGFSASYTMGSITIGGAMNTMDNVNGQATDDKETTEINFALAF